MKFVQFPCRNLKISANLFFPKDYDSNKLHPAIICVHPGGGVKEQTSGLYAELLAESGFISIAYDAAYQGESEGQPRGLEDPAQRVEDISATLDYLSTLPFVDMNRIGVLGICAGGGYAINATLFDKRIKALATVSAVDINGLFRASFGTEPMPTILELLKNASNQRILDGKNERPLYIPFVPNSLSEINEGTPEYAKEAYEYYRTPRGQHCNAKNELLFTSIPKIFSFDAFSQVGDLLTQPVLFIVGEKSDTAYFSEQVFKDVKHSQKILSWVENATHVSLYDKDVPSAIKTINNFFKKEL